MPVNPKTLGVLLLLCCLCLVGSRLQVSAAQADTQQLLRIQGSTTIQPVLSAIAAEYSAATGVELEIRGGGSGSGLRNLAAGLSDIAMVSRPLTAAEKERYTTTVIGYDALAIIINRDNPRTRITTAELRDIFSGRVTTWGEDIKPDDTIILISKQPGRGTLVVFEEHTGLRSPHHGDMPSDSATESPDLMAAHAWEAGANLDAILWVGGLSSAIGFVSFGDADRFISAGQPIRKLILDGAFLDQLSISDGEYPIRRELNLVYDPGNQQAADLARFMLSLPAQQALQHLRLIPVRSDLMWGIPQ